MDTQDIRRILDQIDEVIYISDLNIAVLRKRHWVSLDADGALRAC